MAYVNVAEWKTDQVCEWLKGLENSVLPYVHSFMNHSVNGQQLLSLRPEDLEHLGVVKLGHQEIILEAVEYLRNFHYELDRENLQLLALRLSCQAHSLHNELSRHTDSKPVTTQTLSDVASVIMAVKPLIRWLDRPPFSGHLEYNDKKTELMKLSLEMATCAQRDRFAEKPIEEIRTICGQLAKLSDYIIQDIADPMILQPASLDLATLKKRPGDDLGFYILPSFHGAHQIAEIKFGSAAHQCGKMEEGDEIVQVNYQTVVGWERRNVLELFRESPMEVLLTLKRRPRHTKVYGQIYIKPYRLPSNKKTPYATRWHHNLPSPRPELLTIPDFTMPLPRNTPKNPSPEPTSILDTVSMLDTMATDSSGSDSEADPPLSIRLYSTKPRNLVQRRATITGASPTTKHGIDIEQFWRELKQEHHTTFQLRDKAASCAHGLDSVPTHLRPQTCLGIEQTKRRKKIDNQIDNKKVQFQEKFNELETINFHDSKKIDSKDENCSQSIVVDNKVKQDHVFNESEDKTNKVNVIPINKINDNITNDGKAAEIAQNNIHLDTQLNKKHNKLNESHSLPIYEVATTENKKVEHPPVEKSPKNLSNSSLNKTDLNNSQENFKEISNKMQDEKNELNEVHTSNIIGNVAQKINNFEKNIRSNNTEENKVPELKDSPRNYMNNKNSEVELKNLTVKSESDTKNLYETCPNVGNTQPNVNDLNVMPEEVPEIVITDHTIDNSSLISEENKNKSESSDVYVEDNDSNNETDAALTNFGKILQTIDSALIEHSKMKEKKISTVSLSHAHETSLEPENCENNTPNDESNAVSNIANIDIVNQNNNVQSLNISNYICTTPSSHYSELQKPESTKRIHSKSHLTPPEPPPRKYFTKIDVDSNNSSSFSSDGKPKVPERPNVKKDFRKADFPPESHSRSSSDCSQRIDRFDNYILDKSIELIDETSRSERRSVTSSDTSTYNESTDKSMREERLYVNKFEPFMEKFGVINQNPSEYGVRNIDITDGGAYSRRTQSPELKGKSSDKSVVNRAKMVARSIGLHGGLSKTSNSSPRSSRKKNMLLTKKRNVSVKDVGTGDLEGWLTYRSRGAGGAWAKAWFILKCSSLYRFKKQDSVKADCLIALAGFTVSQASEVKSRKYAFKVYHTGTVFYFAADTEDCLMIWLEAINKATLGADAHNRNSGLFSETDESDVEHNKIKPKSSSTPDYKTNPEKSFGSLKKSTRKESGYKEQEMSGASLDRKYLRFLGTRNQNVPVPTAQFRSYRRVLPTSTSNKKPDGLNSPDLQMTIAGSTFYGLSASQSATDVLNSSSPSMGDYRHTNDRSNNRSGRRPEDFQGFITLEEFMLSQQDDDQRMTNRARRITPLTNDHIHIQHRNFDDCGTSNDQLNNSIIYGPIRNTEEISSASTSSGNFYGQSRVMDTIQSPQHMSSDLYSSRGENRNENVNDRSRAGNGCLPKKSWDFNYNKSSNSKKNSKSCEYSRSGDANCFSDEIQPVQRRLIRYEGYSGSSGDLACHTASDTLQHIKKEVSISRKGSFNLTNRKRDHSNSDKNWLDSLRRTDKKNLNLEKNRLKNVAQYQPPPMLTTPFEQEGMRAAFEMHLDKNETSQKSNRLRSLFGSKSQHKPNTLDLSKEPQKTLLGSPRLHRAFFRDKCPQQTQQRFSTRSDSQSPGDSGISRSLSSFSASSQSHALSQSFSSVNSMSDWSPDSVMPSTFNSSKNTADTTSRSRGFSSGRHSLAPPTLPYIPPPTSPPPDYPDLEYPPVFEPGTYSLSDASFLKNRNKNS